MRPYFLLKGKVYTGCYVTVAISYGDIAYCYGDLASAGTNHDVDATMQ